jgi:hypothetical protein
MPPKKDILTALQHSDLNPLQKVIFEERFLRVLKEFEKRCFLFSCIFHTLRILVSIGSLIVPALLSIQYSDTSGGKSMTDPDSFAYEIYWSTWVISLLVTTSNGILTVFKIDKKYYFLHTTMEKLRSEGWQYLQLSGHYSGFHTPGEVPTHDNQFVFFCHSVERLKMKQVEEEYYKLIENHTVPETNASKVTSAGTLDPEKKDSLLPITPLKPLVEQAKQLPPELLDQIVSMIKSDTAEKSPLNEIIVFESEDKKKEKDRDSLQLRNVSLDTLEAGVSEK